MTLPRVLRSKNHIAAGNKIRKSPISDGRVDNPPLQSYYHKRQLFFLKIRDKLGIRRVGLLGKALQVIQVHPA